MGIISLKCCKYKENEETLKGAISSDDKISKMKLSKLTNSDMMSENISSASVENADRRKVKFSQYIEQRNVHLEDDREYDNIPFEDIQKLTNIKGDNSNDEIITNISWENAENLFVIEDCFYKFTGPIPKVFEEIKFPNNYTESEKSKIKSSHKNEFHELNDISRIDGILATEDKTIIILSEFYIFEIHLNEVSHSSPISLQEIDYITLTRDGKKIIFHLIDNKTFVINNAKLELVAASISASYFYDKSNFFAMKDHNNRRLSVIVLNENFPIINDLEKISNFYDYR